MSEVKSIIEQAREELNEEQRLEKVATAKEILLQIDSLEESLELLKEQVESLESE